MQSDRLHVRAGTTQSHICEYYAKNKMYVPSLSFCVLSWCSLGLGVYICVCINGQLYVY